MTLITAIAAICFLLNEFASAKYNIDRVVEGKSLKVTSLGTYIMRLYYPNIYAKDVYEV